MVRKGDFKLIVYPEQNIRLLFDLKNDPDEINNLADKPEYAAKVQELFSELIKL
jgi:arylsulfatase A-like enzyme